ncbi:hypothetical protein [Nitrobacter sp.]|uniref:hypothetical protein n=1 Tax=Nitrobacter sp. TaxID=29420 RepID=UPI0029CAB304|nr:hypothetical protein [Nitrobacter sp.]
MTIAAGSDSVEGAAYHLSDETWVLPAIDARTQQTRLVIDWTRKKDPDTGEIVYRSRDDKDVFDKAWYENPPEGFEVEKELFPAKNIRASRPVLIHHKFHRYRR